MKKKLFLMIAVLCCMLLLVATVAACEDKGDTGENPGGAVRIPTPVKLKFSRWFRLI